MLTGEPPFRGSMAMVMDQAVHREPVPPQAIRGDVPIDLATICLKCLEKEPEQRYSTASDLAKDLDLYLAGEPINARPVGRFRRICRTCRRRPLVSALAAAVIFLLVVVIPAGSTVWATALAQALANERMARTRADQNYRRALSAANTLVRKVVPEIKPITGTRTETVAGILNSAEQIFRDVLTDSEDVPTALGKADMLRQVSEAYLGLGDADAANEKAREGLAILESWVGRRPHNVVIRGKLAELTNQLGTVLTSQYMPQLAIESLHESLRTTDRLAKQQPHDDSYNGLAAESHYWLANAYHSQDDMPRAVQAARRAVRLRRELAAAGAADPDRIERLASAYRLLGGVLQAVGDSRAAREALEQSLDLANQLVNRSDSNAHWLKLKVDTEIELAKALTSEGDSEAALVLLRSAEQVAEPNATLINPGNVKWQMAHAASRFHQMMVRSEGDLTSALKNLLDSLVRLHDLTDERATRYPNSAIVRADLARMKSFYGLALVQLEAREPDEGDQRLAEALQLFKEARAIHEQLLQRDDTCYDAQLGLSNCWNYAGLALSLTGPADAALQARALEARLRGHTGKVQFYQRRVRDEPERLHWLRRLADAQLDTAMCYCQDNRFTEGAATLRDYVATRRKISHRDDSTRSQRDLANALEWLSDVTDELVHARQAVTLREMLVEHNEGNAELLAELATSYRNLAQGLRLAEQPEEATAAYGRYLATLERRCVLSPKYLPFLSPGYESESSRTLVAASASSYESRRAEFLQETLHIAQQRYDISPSRDHASLLVETYWDVADWEVSRDDPDAAIEALSAAVEILQQRQKRGALHPIEQRRLAVIQDRLQELAA